MTYHQQQQQQQQKQGTRWIMGFCLCVLLEVLKMEGQIVASGELKPFSFALVHDTL